jgi:hypothetical protein
MKQNVCAMIMCIFFIMTGIATAADTFRPPGKTAEERTFTLIIIQINLDTHSVVLKDENSKSYECFVDPKEVDINTLKIGQTVVMSYEEYMSLTGGHVQRAENSKPVLNFRKSS